MPDFDGFAQLEAPTAYLNSDFTAASSLDTATGVLTNIEDGGELNDPPIIHTPDNQFALGVISEQRDTTSGGAPGLHYGYFSYNIQPFDQKPYKWSVVVREDLKKGDSFYEIW